MYVATALTKVESTKFGWLYLIHDVSAFKSLYQVHKESSFITQGISVTVTVIQVLKVTVVLTHL